MIRLFDEEYTEEELWGSQLVALSVSDRMVQIFVIDSNGSRHVAGLAFRNSTDVGHYIKEWRQAKNYAADICLNTMLGRI